MGQITQPTPQSIILTAVDRLIAANAGGGIAPTVSHIILFGENTGQNLQASNVIAMGTSTAKNVPVTATNLIAIGQNSGNGVVPAGVIVIGAGSLNGPVGTTATDMLVIGNRNAQLLTSIGAAYDSVPIIIGSDICSAYTTTSLTDFIAIGRRILPTHNATGPTLGQQHSIMIGSDIKNARSTGTGSDGNQIFIGHNILQSVTVGQSQKSILIGNDMFVAVNDSGSFDCANAIVIGHSLSTGSVTDFTSLGLSVVIGQNVVCTSGSNPTAGGSKSVFIGSTCQINSMDNAVQVGYGNTSPGTSATRATRNIIIGYLNGMRLGAWSDGVLIGHSNTKTNLGDTVMALGSMLAIAQNENLLIGGQFTTGNVALGRGTTFPLATITGATNAVFLRDGNRGANNPAAGGFFYVEAGVLHWVRSDGYDVIVSPASGILAEAFNTSYANGAGGAAATLLNAPAAGNPTKWIPVNDNGTTRYIPAW